MVTAEANGRRTRRARCVTIGEEELFKMEKYAAKVFQMPRELDQMLPRGKYLFVSGRSVAFSVFTK